MSRFILASQSPRRRQLLQDAGYSVTCHNPAVEELCDAEKPHELVSLNASLKAMEVAVKFPDTVVLAADTLVVFAGEIFGKPASMEDAFRMLRKLSGATHEVLTGVCIVKFDGMRICRFEDRSYVKFRTLTDAMIEEYFGDINPLDKAGAYAAQEDNGRIIEGIEGSLTNVIGLPMERLQLAMAEHFPEIVSRKV